MARGYADRFISGTPKLEAAKKILKEWKHKNFKTCILTRQTNELKMQTTENHLLITVE